MNRNIFWVAAAQVSKIFSQAAGLYYYSRVLGPESVGVMAIATAIINFSNIFRDFGASAAIIQRECVDSVFLSTVYWSNVVNGLIIFIIFYFASDSAAVFFGMPDLSGVMKILAFVFPVVSFSLVKQALIERDMEFKTIAIAEVFSSYFGVLFGCLAAYNGYDAKSIAIQSLASAVILSVVYFFAKKWSPIFCFDIGCLSGINKFSGNYTAFTLVNYSYRNFDIFVVGKFMGEFYAGLYSQASKLMMIPLQLLSSIANRVLFPELSRVADKNHEFRLKYKNSTELVAFLSAYVSLIFIIDSDYLVNLILGPSWGGVAGLVVYMFPAGFFQSIMSTTGSVFMAKGRTDIQLKLGLIGALIMSTSFIAGIFFDLDAMVKAYLVATVINSIPCFYITSRVVGGGVLFFPKIISTPIAISICAYFFAIKLVDNFFVEFVDVFWQKIIFATIIYWVCFLICKIKPFRR